jgi:4-diphosphocytidyl-2-C-methyl-D-erythritol kinase
VARPAPGPTAPDCTIVLKAPAKVNLFLSVGPLRRDGYHELLTLFEAVPLEDVVTVAVRPSPNGVWSIRARARVRGRAAGLPRDLENLAGRAAQLYTEALSARSQHGSVASVDIRIDKHIPVAAGLGGGSSDAAAVLRALQEHYGHPLTSAVLHETAAALGSDVLFFLSAGRAVGRSRGEVLSPVPVTRRLPLVLGLPSFGLSTPEVYRRFDRMAAGGGGPPAPAEAELGRLLEALAGGNLTEVAARLRNDLQAAALTLRPEVGRVIDILREAGCLAALVSGSGPSVFGLAPGAAEAEGIARRAHGMLPGALKGRVLFRPVLSPPPDPEGADREAANKSPARTYSLG